jgi:hypothetical protein
MNIGAGMDFSLEVATRRGRAARGLELNRVLAQYARERGLDVENVYLDANQRGEYAMILLDNVPEHVLDPVGFLRQAGNLLASSGFMTVAVPPMD